MPYEITARKQLPRFRFDPRIARSIKGFRIAQHASFAEELSLSVRILVKRGYFITEEVSKSEGGVMECAGFV